MPNNVPIMLFVLLALVLLPIRLSALQLRWLAFFLWLIGGIFLTWRGVMYMGAADHPDTTTLALAAAAAIVIGWAKGQFVLSKTSRRNIERLNALPGPARPVYVYGMRSWIVIGLMALIGQSLTWFNVPLLPRGAVNLGIGIGLIISSIAYIRTFSPRPSAG